MKALGLQHDLEDGILRVVFDCRNERVNLLNAAILEELARLLDRARADDEVRSVLFVSDKPGVFIAGMDVEQIGAIQDAYRAAEAARFGQAVFQRVASLGKPSAAAIGGTCLGGGTELVLACSFRLGADDPAFRIGLPEVRIGIIPGFGGTQRLPRLVGLNAALDLILTGRQLDGRRARQLGLVDRLVPPAYLEREATALLRQANEQGLEATVARIRRRRPWFAERLESLGPWRRFVLEQARRRTAKKVDVRHYPAPFRALEAIEGAWSQTTLQGLDLEARIVGELIPDPTAKNLIWLFKSQSALKNDGRSIQAVPRRVRRAAVIGAGVMGGGIAQLLADREIPVRLKDLQYDAILTALATARGIWDRAKRRQRIDERILRQRMAYIAPTLEPTGLAQVDVVLEAVVEQLEVKQQVLADVEARVDERVVFATNTSSIPIGEIGARALHPERVVGLHFFNPVHRMPLVEVIAGRVSSPEAVATVHALAKRLGKVPVIVRDGPGFLVNRILTPYLNEAMQLLGEGQRIQALDQAMVTFGMPLGPLSLLDQVGLDTARHVGAVLKAAFGERVGSSEGVLDRLVADDRRGQKNERGFYRYRNGRATTPDPSAYELIGNPAPRELPPETLQERMVLVMINEAARCLEERVVREPRDVDVAMVMGTGFPPFRGGLLRHADSIGVPLVVDRLNRLADAQGDRFRPTELLGVMVREQRRFYEDSPIRHPVG